MNTDMVPKDAVYKIEKYWPFSPAELAKTYYYGDRTLFRRQLTRYTNENWAILKAYYFWDNVWNLVGTHTPTKET